HDRLDFNLFQSRSGFLPHRDAVEAAEAAAGGAVSIPFWVSTASRQRVLLTRVGHDLRFQSRSGFLPHRDDLFPEVVRYLMVSIPFWVSTASRQGVYIRREHLYLSLVEQERGCRSWTPAVHSFEKGR
ncbi:hypothetical protein, partial [Haloferax sulfurifontis]